MDEIQERVKPVEGTKALNARRVSPKSPPNVSASGSEKDTLTAKAEAKKLKMPFVDPLCVRIEPAAVALLEPEMAISRQALPIRLVNGTLLIAMASPGDTVAVKSLELLTGFKISPAAAPKSSVSKALEKVYGKGAVPSAKNRQSTAMFAPAEASLQRKEGAFSISIISNKGGVGKTHLSINLAYALADTGAKALLIDADLGNPDISNKLGIFPQYHLLDFLEKDHKMQDLIFSTKFHFDLIGGTFGEFKLANLNHAQKMKFIKHFKKISKEYDFVVFDLGAGISRTVLDFALAANRIVIITTPHPRT
jgi:Mrp family chromosome partitioning ATPase